MTKESTTKNSRSAVRSRMARKVAVVGMLAGVSLSMVGCGAIGNALAPVSSAPASYGVAVGSGEKVKTKAGSYEKLSIPYNSPLYVFNNGKGVTEDLNKFGFDEYSGEQGQKVAVDYVVKELLDSTALEGGDTAYKAWHKSTAPKYFDSSVLPDLALKPGSYQAILGNIGGSNSIPALINDGGPRIKNLDVKVVSAKASPIDQETTGIQYTIAYTADYRITDASAAEFAGVHLGITPEQFLKSSQATEKVKDGKGENVHRAKGTADITVKPDLGGDTWKITTFKSKTDFDSGDYSQKAKK